MANELKEALKDAGNKIAKAIKDPIVDFTTIEVTTVTGDVELLFDNKKFAKLDKNLFDKVKPSQGSKLKIIAHTQIHFDHDTINYVKSDLTEQERDLLLLHQDALQSAHEGRNGFLGLLQKVIV